MKTAVILASGPSLTQEQIDAALCGRFFTIAVNATYAKAPTADVLYSGDYLFLKHYIADIRRTFKGHVWTQDGAAAERWKLHRARATNREGLGRECIHLGGNSGTQALNLAFLWGYRRIVLAGYDMKLGPKGERHHHADHPAPLVQNQCFEEWRHKLKKVAADLEKEGVEVLNATPDSALTCFKMVDWREVLK